MVVAFIIDSKAAEFCPMDEQFDIYGAVYNKFLSRTKTVHDLHGSVYCGSRVTFPKWTWKFSVFFQLRRQ